MDRLEHSCYTQDVSKMHPGDQGLCLVTEPSGSLGAASLPVVSDMPQIMERCRAGHCLARSSLL